MPLLFLAACSGGEQSVAPTTTSTSTSTTVTTTTITTTLPDEEPKVVITPSGVVAPVLGREPGGLVVGTPCGSRALVASATPVVRAAVVIDAGHGGDESGAIGPNGLREREVNLAVAERTKAVLDAAGHPAVLTRAGDYRMTLESRSAVVRALGPQAFVSIHHNAQPDGPRESPGTETFYQVASPESKRLAGLVYEEVVRALAPLGAAWVGDLDAGAKYRRNSRGDDYYGILRRTQGTPGILAELGFLSNPPEAELYARPDVQQVEAEATARGVLRFLTTADPGSGYTEPYPRTTPAGPGGGSGGCRDPAL